MDDKVTMDDVYNLVTWSVFTDIIKHKRWYYHSENGKLQTQQCFFFSKMSDISWK